VKLQEEVDEDEEDESMDERMVRRIRRIAQKSCADDPDFDFDSDAVLAPKGHRGSRDPQLSAKYRTIPLVLTILIPKQAGLKLICLTSCDACWPSHIHQSPANQKPNASYADYCLVDAQHTMIPQRVARFGMWVRKIR